MGKEMNSSSPRFWALIGFGVGAVIAAAGTYSSPLDSMLGGLIQATIWFGVSSLFLRKRKLKESVKIDTNPQLAQNHPVESSYIQIKACESCGNRVPLDYLKCFNCEGSSFLHQKISRLDYEQGLMSSVIPETKNCPMCAEEIKYAAKKCRYCQHMMET